MSALDESALESGRASFVLGEHVALVGPSGAALVDGGAEAGFVDQLWELVGAGKASRELSEFLVAYGLSALPSIAMVMLDKDPGTAAARVIVRGDLSASVERSDGSVEVVDPGDAITWVERAVAEPVSARLGPAMPSGTGDPTSTFEVSEGRVPAKWIRVPCAVDAVDQLSERDVDPRGDAGEPAGSPADEPADTTPPDAVEADAVEEDASSQNHTVPPSDEPPPFVGSQDADAAPPGLEAPGSDQPWVGLPDVSEPPAPVFVPPRPPDPGEEPEAEPERASSGHTVRFDPDGTGQAEALGDANEAEPNEADDDGLGGLFGVTEHRPVASAGVDEPPPSPEDPGLISEIPGEGSSPSVSEAPFEDEGDHDGMTISLAQLKAQRAAAGLPDEVPPALDGVGRADARAELVQAVSCPSGHLNPPAAASCRVCGIEVPPQDYESVPRPVLGVLRFSDGTDRPLSRSMLLGRSPKAAGSLTGEQLPELVTLDSPTRELSGTHLEIRLEGWQVLAIDRRSTNGTTVQLPGRDPQRLHPGNAVPIVPGTVIDMADEVQLTYEVEP